MERVRISISGRDFNLKTDNPDRLYAVASNLQKKIDNMTAVAANMSFTDVVLLSALDIADESYDSKKAIAEAVTAAETAEKKLLEANKALVHSENKNEVLVKENNDFISLLDESDKRCEQLQKKLDSIDLSDYEAIKAENEQLNRNVEHLENKTAAMERAWNALKSDYDKQQSKDRTSPEQAAEIETLKATVATYEKTFDEYVTQRNAEVAQLNDELNKLRKKYAELNDQMNEIVNDGQMTL